MSIDNLQHVWPEWKIEKEIGKGSYGTVYQVVHMEHGVESCAAIKVISIPKDQSEIDSLRSEGIDINGTRTYFKGIVNDFVNEIKIMNTLKGLQNIVSIEDYKVREKEDSIGWDIYIRMELLTPLNTYLFGKKLTEKLVVKLGCDICTALELCGRKNIIHRDIKPGNIFINDNGDFKLGDFGIARKMENATCGFSQRGTYDYMAPEVVNTPKYDSRVDIYSLGIVLYRYMNGNLLPFIDSEKQLLSPEERKAAFSRRLNGEKLPTPKEASKKMANLILRACAYNPNKRFKNATEMKNALISVGNRTKRVVPVRVEKTIQVRPAEGENKNGNKSSTNEFGERKSNKPKVIIAFFILIILIGAGIIMIPHVKNAFISTFTANDGDIPSDPVFLETEDISRTEISDDTSTVTETTAVMTTETTVEVTSISLNKTSLSLTVGSSETLIMTVFPVNATDKSVTWSSGNPSVATVTEGKIKAISSGTTLIKVKTSNGKITTCSVTVKTTDVEVSSLTLNASVFTLDPGYSVFLKVNISPDNALNKTVTWISSDINVASVDNTGKVTAKKEGKTIITVKSSNGLTAECLITVNKTIIAVKQIILDHNTLTLTAGQSFNFAPSVTPDNADDKRITLVSSNKNVAVVSGFKVTAVGVGSAIITATASDGYGATSTCAVTVTAFATEIIKIDKSKPETINAKDIEYTILNGEITINKYIGSKTNIVIPSDIDGYTVTNIGDSAFIDCSSITSITIPDKVTNIGFYTFLGCSSLTSITMPDNLIKIGVHAFSNCISLTSITIPDSVTYIDQFAFSNCSNLLKIEVSSSNLKYSSENGILFDKNKEILICYPAGKKDNTYSIPNSVTCIEDGAFEYCNNINNITLPNSVTSIGRYAFSRCINLKSITIPDNVTNIYDSAFSYCSNLKSITISDSVTNISNFVFIGCTSLEKIEVTSSNLKYSSEDGMLFDKNKILLLCYPAGKRDSIYSIPFSFTHVGIGAFANCNNLTSIKISDSVTNIGIDAFSNCNNLSSINFPKSISYIGDKALYGCKNLKSILIESGSYAETWCIDNGYSDLLVY